ncbi:DUF6508 domain-containing protein [Paenibacillus aceti]|uniref:Uncharacterized protein n=1 Tax=Paenibacillus aceti TaxID=1820010 RepID=A0ABQ1VRG1_9BACL|nr:DUF6508 domain-containing protein [Paenibacillus aceti]GGF92616.1 hypothetical protein GCM10010913_12730 [Paenibacillus aceti]
MPNHRVVTIEEINKLVGYLEYFQDPNRVLFTEVNGYILESEEVSKFRRDLDDTGFLVVFDWTSWINDNEVFRDIDNNIQEHIRNADLDTLRQLMTSYIRGDRFNEGLFIHVIQKGHISNILLRLQELGRYNDEL